MSSQKPIDNPTVQNSIISNHRIDQEHVEQCIPTVGQVYADEPYSTNCSYIVSIFVMNFQGNKCVD